jgi:hypothetical protein
VLLAISAILATVLVLSLVSVGLAPARHANVENGGGRGDPTVVVRNTDPARGSAR